MKNNKSIVEDWIEMSCPECGKIQKDYDGFGVLYCPSCGYCTHSSITGNICGFCKKEIITPQP